MTFGKKLKQLREKFELTQEELAQKLKVSRQAVYKWETDKGYPDMENLIQISELFQVTIDELMKTDKKLQQKFRIDKPKQLLQWVDPGFYLGFILILLGIFVFEDSSVFFILGAITMVFFTDMVKSIISFFRSL